MAYIWSRETPFALSDDRYGIVVLKVGLAISLALAFSSTTTKTCFTGDFAVGAAEAGTPPALTPTTLNAAIAAAHHRRIPTAGPSAADRARTVPRLGGRWARSGASSGGVALCSRVRHRAATRPRTGGPGGVGWPYPLL